MTRRAHGGQSLQCWNSTASPAHHAGNGNGNGNGSMDNRNLNHGHAVGAEDLRLASLCPVHGRINSYVMGNMSGSAASSGNHVSHTVALAVGVGGTLVDSVKKHVVASSLMVGGQLYLNQLCLGRIIASALTLAVWLEYGLLYNREVALPDIFKC